MLPVPCQCRYVIHAAGVVSLNAPKKVAYSHVIEPTLRGIENVLSAVNKTASVEKGGQLVGAVRGQAQRPMRSASGGAQPLRRRLWS